MGSTRRRRAAAWSAGVVALSLSAVWVASRYPITLIVLGVVGVVVHMAIRRPHLTSAILVVISLPLMRPAILGEHFALLATGLCLIAGFVAFVSDIHDLSYPRAYMVLLAFISVAQLWLIFRGIFYTGAVVNQATSVAGFITTPVTVGAIGIVAADIRRLRFIASAFFWITVIVCASYLITVICWFMGGVGTLAVGSIAIVRDKPPGTMFFPLTPTLSTTAVESFGITLPRLTGWGREPGWMALFCVVSWFLSPVVGKTQLFTRPLLLIGLLGTTSTAGFGVFIVAVALEYFLRPRPERGLLSSYAWFLVGLASLWIAVRVAVNAPVLGLAAKATINSVSLDGRSSATSAGLDAVFSNPLGGASSGPIDAINIVASIGPYGVPYAFLIICAILIPRFAVKRSARGMTTTPIAAIFLTLLLSQPPADSTLIFVVAGLTYALAAGREPEVDSKGAAKNVAWLSVDGGRYGG